MMRLHAEIPEAPRVARIVSTRVLVAAWGVYDAQLLPLDYPVDPTPRYPLGHSAHPRLLKWFDSQRAASEDVLRSIAGLRRQLEAIPRAAGDPTQPHWDNGWFSALDAMTLYAVGRDARTRADHRSGFRQLDAIRRQSHT
jgi:hypothetical protein